MDTDRPWIEEYLEDLWEAVRQGDPEALNSLLTFIIRDGRRHLRRYILQADFPNSGRPTEILQRTAVKIHQKVMAGTLAKPQKTALKTLGRFLVLTGKEVLQFLKITGGKLPPAIRFGLRQSHGLTTDPKAETPFQKVSDLEDAGRKKARLRQEVSRLLEPDRSILEKSLVGKSDHDIALELGLSSDNIRQRRHRATVRLAAILRQEFAA